MGHAASPVPLRRFERVSSRGVRPPGVAADHRATGWFKAEIAPVSFRRSILLLKWSSGAVDLLCMNILYVIIAVLVIIFLLRVLGAV